MCTPAHQDDWLAWREVKCLELVLMHWVENVFWSSADSVSTRFLSSADLFLSADSVRKSICQQILHLADLHYHFCWQILSSLFFGQQPLFCQPILCTDFSCCQPIPRHESQWEPPLVPLDNNLFVTITPWNIQRFLRRFHHQKFFFQADCIRGCFVSGGFCCQQILFLSADSVSNLALSADLFFVSKRLCICHQIDAHAGVFSFAPGSF